MKKILFSLILSSVLISSCGIPDSPKLVANPDVSEKLAVKKDISGQAIFPKSFKVKSTASYIPNKATVSLIYPSDYPDINLRNSSIIAGISDSEGNFKLHFDSSFYPNINEILVLEVVKRKDGAGTGLLSLRTHLRWTGTVWESITGTTIRINVETSVLSAISNLNHLDLSPENTINKVTVDSNDNSTFQAISKNITLDLLNYLTHGFEDEISHDKDPIENVRYDKNSRMSYRYYIDEKS